MADLSPRALAAAAHVTALETELAQLRAEVAPTLERIAILERSLEAVELAAHPKQAGLPGIDVGPPGKLREPTRMAEQLLRSAMPGGADCGPGPWTITIPRAAARRGEIKCASALAKGDRPLFVEESRSKSAVTYKLTADGETVARALPANGGANG